MHALQHEKRISWILSRAPLTLEHGISVQYMYILNICDHARSCTTLYVYSGVETFRYTKACAVTSRCKLVCKYTHTHIRLYAHSITTFVFVYDANKRMRNTCFSQNLTKAGSFVREKLFSFAQKYIFFSQSEKKKFPHKLCFRTFLVIPLLML